MSKEYIERSAVIAALKSLPFQADIDNLDVYVEVETVPAVDVEPVRHGEWVFINQATNYLEPPCGDTCGCSVCGYEIDVSDTYRFRYCPICGAKMDGGNQ